MAKKWGYALAFYGWMILITLLSLIRFPEDPVSDLKIPHLDKIVHFTFYFVAVILGGFYLISGISKRLSISKALLFSVLFACSYCIVIEVLQGVMTTDRSGDIRDVLANCFGAVFGMLLLKLWFSGKREEKWKH